MSSTSDSVLDVFLLTVAKTFSLLNSCGLLKRSKASCTGIFRLTNAFRFRNCCDRSFIFPTTISIPHSSHAKPRTSALGVNFSWRYNLKRCLWSPSALAAAVSFPLNCVSTTSRNFAAASLRNSLSISVKRFDICLRCRLYLVTREKQFILRAKKFAPHRKEFCFVL